MCNQVVAANRAHKRSDRVLRSWLGKTIATALTGGTAVGGRPLWQRLFGAPELRAVLHGRNVLVTGASSGIGRAVALKAAAAGATALLVARSELQLRELQLEIERAGGRARSYPADLSSATSTAALLASLKADGIAVDVLINNAGRSIRRAVAQSYDRMHDFERTMALNYFGALRLILGLLPAMRARRDGHVINVSTAGVQIGTPLFSAYIASKAALDAFSRIAASESQDDDVRFTTVHMPLVRTKMIAPTPEFDDVPALSPDAAADMVLRPLVTGERQLGARLANLLQLGHLLVPSALAYLLALADGERRQLPCEQPLSHAGKLA